MEDRLRAFGRQRDGKGTVRVGPGHQEHRHLLAPFGKVHVDVPEIALGTLTRIMVERDKRLHPAPLLAANIETYPFLAAGVAVFVAQAAKDFSGGVPLLARSILVRLQDRIDRRLERIENRGRRLPRISLRLRLPEDLTDLAPRVMEATG